MILPSHCMEWNSFQETTRRLRIFHVKTRGDEEEEEEEELFRIEEGIESLQHF